MPRDWEIRNLTSSIRCLYCNEPVVGWGGLFCCQQHKEAWERERERTYHEWKLRENLRTILDTIEQEMPRLKRMRDDGFLSEDEYHHLKNRIMGVLVNSVLLLEGGGNDGNQQKKN